MNSKLHHNIKQKNELQNLSKKISLLYIFYNRLVLYYYLHYR